MLVTLIAIALSLAASAFGYATARRFVHNRLKFVDAAQTMKAPIMAGLVAWALFMPLTFLPLINIFVGAGTAIVFGLSVGMGVRAGQKDIKFGRITGG